MEAMKGVDELCEEPKECISLQWGKVMCILKEWMESKYWYSPNSLEGSFNCIWCNHLANPSERKRVGSFESGVVKQFCCEAIKEIMHYTACWPSTCAAVRLRHTNVKTAHNRMFVNLAYSSASLVGIDLSITRYGWLVEINGDEMKT